MRVLGLLMTILCACSQTITPSKPSIEVDGGGGAVMLGQPFYVWTSWHGTCEPSGFELFNLGDSHGPRTEACDFVKYEVSVRCDNDACTSLIDKDKRIQITPTKLGALKAHVTLNPKGLHKTKSFDVEPVMVVTPTSASAICDSLKDGMAQVDVALAAKNHELEHESKVKVSGGGDCTLNGFEARYYEHKRGYTCPISTPNVELEVASATYSFKVPTTCNASGKP